MQTVRSQYAVAQPGARSFSGLMDLYELNYIRLRRLLPEADRLGGSAVSVVPRGLDLHYRLIDRCRYTRTFVLTYRFDEAGGVQLAPDLQIRLYLDARLAEVISGVLHRHYVHRDRPRPEEAMVDPGMGPVTARWQLNRFLYKWLNFCLKQGHVFRPKAGWGNLPWLHQAPGGR